VKVTLIIENGDGRVERHEVDEPRATMAAPLIFRTTHMAMSNRHDEIASIKAALSYIGEFMRLASTGDVNG